MRHRARNDRLGRFSSLRKATLKSLTTAVLLHQKIITTKAKADSARRVIENIITLGKKGTLSSKRRAFSLLCDHSLVKLLFESIAPKFANVNGGYTRVTFLRNRRGDNAKLVVLELTQAYKAEKPKEKIEKKEKVIKEKIETKEKPLPKEQKPLPPEAKEIKETAWHPTTPSAHPQEEKTKKPEAKKPKKFFGGFKGLFKKERDSL